MIDCADAARQDVVIATGGGAVLMPENRERLASRGCVVYLKTGIHQQLERTRHGRQRPLLYTADPEAKLRELMDASRAAVRVDRRRSSSRPTAGTCAPSRTRLLQRLQERLRAPTIERLRCIERVDIALGERSYPILIGPRPARRSRSCSASTSPRATC